MATRMLAVSTVLLAALLLHQYSRTTQLRNELAGAEVRAAADARASVLASLSALGPELQRAMIWLDGFYRSAEGLQRAEGIWVEGHPDFEAIRVWMFDVYLHHRLSGDSEETSRQAIVAAIRQSDEWRAKHRR